jgi:hypothetical protein
VIESLILVKKFLPQSYEAVLAWSKNKFTIVWRSLSTSFPFCDPLVKTPYMDHMDQQHKLWYSMIQFRLVVRSSIVVHRCHPILLWIKKKLYIWKKKSQQKNSLCIVTFHRLGNNHKCLSHWAQFSCDLTK